VKNMKRITTLIILQILLVSSISILHPNTKFLGSNSFSIKVKKSVYNLSKTTKGTARVYDIVTSNEQHLMHIKSEISQRSSIIYLTSINRLVYPLTGNNTHWWRENASQGRLIGRFQELALIQDGNQVIAYNTTTNTTEWSKTFTVEYISVGDPDNDGKDELFFVNNDTVYIIEKDGTELYNDEVIVNKTSYPIFSITASNGLILFVYKNTTDGSYYPAKATFEEFKNRIAHTRSAYKINESYGRIIAIKQGFYWIVFDKINTLFDIIDTNFNSIGPLILSSAYSGFATNMQKYWIIPDQDGDGYDDIIISNETKSMSIVGLAGTPVYETYELVTDVEILGSDVYAIINHKLYWMDSSYTLQLNRTDFYIIDLDTYNILYALASGGLIIKNIQRQGNEEFIVVPEAPLEACSSLNYLCYWTRKIAWTPYGTLEFVDTNISKCICGEHAFGVLLENGTLLIYNETHLLKKLNDIEDINALDYNKEQKAFYLAFPNGIVEMLYPEGSQSRILGIVSMLLVKSNVYIMYYNETHVIIEEFDWTLTPVNRSYTLRVKNSICLGAYADFDNDGLFEFAVSAYNSTYGEYAILSETLALVHKEETSGLIQVWSFGDGFVIYNGTYGRIHPTSKVFPMSTPASSSYHLIVSNTESYYFTNQSLGAKGDGGIAGYVVAEYETSVDFKIIGRYWIENQTLTGIDRRSPNAEIVNLPHDAHLNAYILKPDVQFEVNVSDDIQVDTIVVCLNDTVKFSQKINQQKAVVQVSFTSNEGYYEIKIVVNDTSGKETILTNYTYIDGTPPAVFLSVPNLTNDTEVLVSWNSEDELTYVSKIEIYVNETKKAELPSTEQQFSGSYNILLGGEGNYNITILAYDPAGNIGKDAKFIEVDLTLPELIVYGIINNSALIANSINASISASDENGVKRLLVIRNGSTILNTTSASASISIPLLDGVNKITFEAIDNAGNIRKLVYYVYKDVTPPSIKINNPANNSWLASNQVNVSWTASDDLELDKFEIYINGILNNTLPPDSKWVDIVLRDGVWNITIIAYDKVGNANSSTIIIYIDTTPPFVKIISPSNGSFLSTTSVIVTWNMSDNLKIDKIEVYLDDEKQAEILPPTNQYQFTNLAERTHKIKIMIYDKLKHVAFDEIVIVVDLTKPNIKIVSPQSNTYVSGSFALIWNASDNYGIQKFVVYANAEKIAELSENETSINITLYDGVYTIKVVAIDYAENKDYDQISVIVDTVPPSVKIISPSSLTIIYAADFVVMWNASDKLGLDRIQVWLNESLKAELPPNTSEYKFVGIPNGAYLIKIVAIDRAGNSADDSIIIIVDAPLSVRISSPLNGTWFNTRVITIKLTISNTTELKNVTIYVDKDLLITNTTNVTFNLLLSEGIHNVTVVVEDIANNVAMDSIIIFVDITPPNVRITSPRNETQLEPSNITINWIASDNFEIKIFKIYINETLIKATDQTSITIYLDEGVWIIKVEAEDYAGNKGVSLVKIIVKSQAPMAEITTILLLMIPIIAGTLTAAILLIRAKKLHEARRRRASLS